MRSGKVGWVAGSVNGGRGALGSRQRERYDFAFRLRREKLPDEEFDVSAPDQVGPLAPAAVVERQGSNTVNILPWRQPVIAFSFSFLEFTEKEFQPRSNPRFREQPYISVSVSTLYHM